MLELLPSETTRVHGKVHQVEIVDPLTSRDKILVHLELGIDRAQEITHRCEEPLFVVWQVKSRNHQDRNADARLKLPPGQRASDETANSAIGAEHFEKVQYLAFALEGFKLNKASTTQLSGATADSESHSPTVASFGDKRLEWFVFNRPELPRRQDTLGKNIPHLSIPDRMVIHRGFGGNKRRTQDASRREKSMLEEDVELSPRITSRRFIVPQSRMGLSLLHI